MIQEFKPNVYSSSRYHSLLGLYPVWVGHIAATEKYECKPRVLGDYYLIYVKSGKGYFKCLDEDYILEKGDVYFLFPGVKHYYRTDPKELLELLWIGFNGPSVEELMNEIGVNPHNPIIKNISNNRLFNCIQESAELTQDSLLSDLLNGTGNLYKIFGLLMEICSPAKPSSTELKQIHSRPVLSGLKYMNINYPEPITIDDVASYSGLSRCYFAVIFKTEVGCSPLDYLSNLRLENSKRYLGDLTLSINEVAHSVGFQDPLYFSKFFFKFEKISPRDYRRKNFLKSYEL